MVKVAEKVRGGKGGKSEGERENGRTNGNEPKGPIYRVLLRFSSSNCFSVSTP